MKCPECKNKFPFEGNSKEEMGKTILVCPKCSTSFEIQAVQKMFPKGTIIFLIATFSLGLFPVEVSGPILLVVIVLLVRWVFKPENVIAGNS